MTVRYVSVEDAIGRSGLRMVVVGGVPSPWSEAAKGIFHIKRIAWVAVRLAYDSEALKQWSGHRNAPVAVYDNEPPRARWDEILALAERLAPAPALLPAEADARSAVIALSSALCGEGGLGWTRRLQLIHGGLNGRGGFAPRVASYLAKKYGHSAESGEAAGTRVVAMLDDLAARLKAQEAAGSPYLIGNDLTAADVYLAAVMALFAPLPQAQCDMDPATRAAMETLDAPTAAALDGVLLAHREMMYSRYLELPLAL